jgi:tetratricopeptide (TPR) repeat protein
LVLVAAAYAPSLGNRFALDDRLAAMAVRDDGTQNRMVAELQPLAAYFTANYWQGFLGGDILYRPITVLSYALVYAGIGRHLPGEAGEALPQHAVNWALHLVAVWLVYRLTRVVRVGRTPSVVAAAVFGAHAIHSEVVAGVVGRAELLAFVAGAAASLWFVLAAAKRAGRAFAAGGAALALFLAMGAKESAVAWVPFVLVLVVVRHLRQAGSERAPPPTLRRAAAAVGLWLLVAGPPLLTFMLLRAAMLAGIGADAQAWEQALLRATPGSPLGNALVQWAHALRACLLPTHLAADWGPLVFAPTSSPSSPTALAALALLILALAAALFGWRHRPLVFLAGATFFGHSFLVSNVPFRIGTDYAERLYYTPSLGAALLAAWLAERWPRPWRAWSLILLSAWIAWNFALIVRRNEVWRDNDTLHLHETENQPRSARMHLQWAAQLEQRGDLAATQRHLEAAVDLLPEHAAAWNHLGTVHARAGRDAAALHCFSRSTSARAAEPAVRAAAAINLARAHATMGQLEPAMAALELARSADAKHAAASAPDLRAVFAPFLPYAWLDAFLASLQDLVPDARNWACERACLAYDSRQPTAAAAHARHALGGTLPPETRAQMHFVLAVSLATLGDRKGAVQAAEAVVADPTAPAALRDPARDLLQRLR